MSIIRVAVVDDELLFVEGIKLILNPNEDIQVTYTASDGQQLIDDLKDMTELPDVILLDLSMPILDGVDTLIRLNELNIPTPVIILTSHYNDSIIIRLLDEGAAGFLAKNDHPNQVVATIRGVSQKGFHINDYIVNLIRERRIFGNAKTISEDLSSREKEVLQLICEELTNREIAEKLFISPRTVDGHRNRILEKTGCKNTAGLVIYAIEHQLIDVNVKKYM